MVLRLPTAVRLTVARVRRAPARVGDLLRTLRRRYRSAVALVTTAAGLVRRADDVLRRSEDLLVRAETGVARIEQAATRATLTVDEVRGVAQQARTQVESLAGLTRGAEQVSGADLQRVLTTVQELRQLVEGLPGVGFMRRRSEG